MARIAKIASTAPAAGGAAVGSRGASGTPPSLHDTSAGRISVATWPGGPIAVAMASAARTRPAASSSGTVSNQVVEHNGKKDWPKGYSCIAEKRAIETILDGKPSTEFMKYGDTIRIEMKGTDGSSVFGAIDQKIAPLL